MVGRSASGPDAESPVVSVDSVTADGPRIEATVSYSDELRPFFDDSPFYAEYGVDVSDLPESILTIPVLAHVCPVAWAAGADVRVPVADRRFLDSLETVGRALSEMYPFVEGGRVFVERAPEWDEQVTTGSAGSEALAAGDPAGADGTGMLFTGGVDSLATYVRHREANPTLINVRGWLVGVDDDERWAHTRRRIADYADRLGTDARFVESNMLEFLDTAMLDAHYKARHDGAWYSAVGCGLGLTGLCAPLAVAEGMERLYLAATHWEGFPTAERFEYWDGGAIPWGSDPAIDDEIAWSGTTVVHDAFEITRQERVEVLADYLGEHAPDLPLRACEASATGSNCDRCEKCARTALGLALAGRDPNDHGFDVDAATFERARREIEAGNWLVDFHILAYWLDLQAAVDPDASYPLAGVDAFADWLATADLRAAAARSRPPVSHRVVRAAARAVPAPVYARLSPAYDAVRELSPRS
ncbi:hypothetical protein C475_18283 [Halosimplex carlsbadense 2-9-1]|uniref:Uncharacterized protein n=1 Tax=Halosimplex carlsbadense 2-9-1 TaxID=797114 RepID=M0CJE9_9EURY|nr:hypothetical protein [Halosimplex carlsbadense]ELZ22487.1 hypothetical protein C475_18283 [Halosimplex carlsbadense 2-9-1]